MIKGKPDPFQYMILHRKVIIKILDQSSTLKSAWNMLTKSLPEVEAIIKFNTFKGYVRILKVVDGELAELILENRSISQKLGKVRQENKAIEEELGKVRQKKVEIEEELGRIKKKLNRISNETKEGAPQKCTKGNTPDHKKTSLSDEISVILPNHKKDYVPKRIDGWGVQLRGRYYRIFKKIKGKVKWIHIGRNWNTEVAREKIKGFTG